MRWLSGQKRLPYKVEGGNGLQKLSSDLYMSTMTRMHVCTRTTPPHPTSYTYMIIIIKTLNHHFGSFIGLCVGVAKAKLVGSDLWCREIFNWSLTKKRPCVFWSTYFGLHLQITEETERPRHSIIYFQHTFQGQCWESHKEQDTHMT